MVKTLRDDHTVRFEYERETPLVASFDGHLLNKAIAEPIIDGFAQLAGGYSRGSAATFLGSIRRFVRFLESHTALVNAVAFPSNVIVEYRKSVADDSSLQPSSKNTTLNNAIRLMKWLMRNRPTVAAPTLRIQVPRFAVESSLPARPILTSGEIKLVLRACQEEIDFYWDRFSTGKRLLAGSCESEDEFELSSVLKALLGSGGGLFPTQPKLASCSRSLPNMMRRVAKLGGLSSLKEYCFLTPSCAIPFYVSLVAQTAGNADAILSLSRNSLVEHEIFSTSKFVVWEKGRAAKVQRREFDTRKYYAPPNLIDMVREMTSDLVGHCDPIHKEKLFLHQSQAIPGPISRQTLHNRLSDFIEKHRLPSFDPSDLRRTSAELHDQVGGTFAAQKVLNHASVETTKIYIDANRKRQGYDKLIHRFQGQLLTKIMGSEVDKQATGGSISVGVSTTFGFDCKDPLAGIAPGTVKGKLCEKFQMCAACPGAIVVLDDANVASRLLKTRDHLLRFDAIARYQGWGERFDAIYAPSLAILTDLVSKIPDVVRRHAEKLLENIPALPDLE